MKNKLPGFTLIELMVAITIIGVLSSISIIGLNNIRQKAQDTSRLSSLRDLQLSLEAYKSVNGKYPDAGAQGTDSYITGLTPVFITKLPKDSVHTGSAGFIYTVSSDKKSYCVLVQGTVFKSGTQPDLNQPSIPKTWRSCKGPESTPNS